MAFDPLHLETSNVKVKVQIASLKSDDRDAQDNLMTSEWFDAAQYPVAVFEAAKFTHIKDDDYQAEGTLTIRGKKVDITLPFTAKFFDDKDTSPATHYARITGETTIKRLDFGIGTGEWARTDVIADPVKVSVHIEAKQVP
jgi:polyisoprenoid-binding protein YceI